ncbi:MAG: D-alanyl-D-alanine carboxypeptidase/D-alanyl-D-alanine-endopeptidase [Proteobacteria bacterium]|nr:D-alanyl-D-alanine carboxypeptidase/D-alanyl-D-alanine-endopeptidase [Pseudomonadota bacterium]
MNKHTLCFFLTSLMLSSSLQAQDQKFAEKFDKLIKQYLPNTAIGLIIQDPKSGNILFEYHGEDNFYPASNTKLFTAAAALKFFGPNFQYQTTIHALTNKIAQGTLNDNLYFVFRGDPSLSANDLTSLIKQVKDKGINQIKGQVIIDDKSFDDVPYAPGWTWDSIPWAYSAPVTSIILNTNKMRVKLNKAEALNEKIKMERTEDSPPFNLTTNVTAVTLDESEHSCQLNVKVKNNDVKITGCWPINKTPTVFELAMDNPKLMAKNLILQSLKENQIEFAGEVVFMKTPKEIPALVTKRSLPLKNILRQVLSESNNLYTESLTKALGLAFLGQGSFQVGIQAIEEILAQDLQMDFSNINLSDGSGQSRYNLFSPSHVSQLLYHMYHDPQFSFFYEALSTAGKSGTLAERMKNKNMVGKVVAKTGSALGTSALSGYFTANNGTQYLFSIMINQSLNDNAALKSFEDKICQLMVETSWNEMPRTRSLKQSTQPVSKLTPIPF